MINYIVTDLDGTFLKKDFRLGKFSIQIIKQLQKQHMTFLPASGRAYTDIQAMFASHGIHCGAIALNGAQVCNEQGEILCSYPLDQKLVGACLQIMDMHGLSLQIFTADGVYAYPDSQRVQKDMEQVISRNIGQVIPIEVLPTYSLDMLDQPVFKLEAMHMEDHKLAACSQALRSFASISVTSSVPGNLEICNRMADKATALLFLLQQRQITKKEVLIFGDSMNDASLFQQFPYTIAVENAHPWIRKHAYALCPCCEEEGVAHWLQEHLCV